MALPASFRNVKIISNTIDLGFSSTGSVAANYTYDSNMSLGTDAIINGNTFVGCVSNGNAATRLISITSGSSIITNNNFIRGVGSPISAYIYITSTTDQIIKDNFFDQSTVDGTTEDLVFGLPARSIYHSNKNQIGYISVSASAGLSTTDTADFDIVSDASMSVSIDNGYIDVFFATLTVRFFQVDYDLSAILPESVRILRVKSGIYNEFTGAATLTSGTFALNLTVRDIVVANYETGVNSILDSKNNNSVSLESLNGSINLLTNFAALQAATLYASIDTATGNDPDNFITTQDKAITLGISISNDLAVLGGGMFYVISPAVVKFVW